MHTKRLIKIMFLVIPLYIMFNHTKVMMINVNHNVGLVVGRIWDTYWELSLVPIDEIDWIVLYDWKGWD